jgi:hypothetical protein
MSEHQPPAGTPEYLEGGLGRPLPPAPSGEEPSGTRRRRGRRAWWIGGGVVALLGVGAGAWAALSFFQQGAQPAEALPSTTVGYLSVDLDPAGGQKIDAFRTLNKFPAFKDEVGVNSVDELRHKLGEQLISDSGCSTLDYSRDVDPWLGDRMAGAVVPLGADQDPHLVVVVQVKNEGEARAGIAKINGCTDTGDSGVVVKDGWALLAESQKVADEVSAATDDATLADDATYQKWTKAVGDAGVVNAYASPDAGRVLAKELGGFFGGTYATEMKDGVVVPAGFHPSSSAPEDDPFTEALSGFKGGAATLRFTGDGLELAAAGDGATPELADFTGTTGGELVRRLPDDTAAAVSTTLKPGWLSRRLDLADGLFGGGITGDGQRQLERETGLKIPDDIETLLGSGVAISVSKDLDLEAAENTQDGTGLPVGATIKGDPAAIEQVLDKIRAKAGDLPFLGADDSGDLVAIGPTPEYRQRLLAGGNLGDDGTFRSVVPDAADASSVFYVNVDAFEPAITKLAAGEDAKDLANLTPLRAVGISTRTDNGVTRFSLKVSTD